MVNLTTLQHHRVTRLSRGQISVVDFVLLLFRFGDPVTPHEAYAAVARWRRLSLDPNGQLQHMIHLFDASHGYVGNNWLGNPRRIAFGTMHTPLWYRARRGVYYLTRHGVARLRKVLSS